MAIDSYPNLLVALLDMMGRPGDPIATAKAPTWVQLFESRANRELRIRAMEKRATAPVSSEFVALPPDWLQMRNFQINGSPTVALELVAPEFIDRLGVVTPGTPKMFAILTNELQLAPPPAAEMTAEMVYWARLTGLSGENPTNALLLNHPELYLFGTLVEAWSDLDDDDEVAKYEARYQTSLRAVQDADDRAKWSGATMSRRIPGIIYRDNKSLVRGN